MNRNLAILVLLLAAGLGVTSYYWNATWLELGEKKLQLAQAHAENTKLKSDLKNSETEIESLKAQALSDAQRIQQLSGQAQTQSKDLQALDAELAAQRARVEEKRKQYAAVTANTGADAFAATKLKTLNDELQMLTQQKRSVEQDLSNTNYDASAARLNRKRDSQYAIAQANAHSKAQVRADQANQTQMLNVQIKRTVDDLHHEQAELNKKIDAKKAEIFKVQEHGVAANSFQKERADLISKLTNELKEEEDKLKTLEARVQAQKAKADAAVSSRPMAPGR
jgi:chromosome segregation ATPase